MVVLGLGLGFEALKACINRCTVTDAHDSNYHVGNINKFLLVNDFIYLFTVFLLLPEGFQAPWLIIYILFTICGSTTKKIKKNIIKKLNNLTQVT